MESSEEVVPAGDDAHSRDRRASQPVRTSRRPEATKGYDTYGSNEKINISESDEEQGLLSEAEDLATARGPERRRPKYANTSYRRLCTPRLGSATGLLATGLAILLGIIVFWNASARPDAPNDLGKPNTNHARGDKYLLDPNWDLSESPRRREFEFILRDEVLNPDGVYRPMMTINGEFPGPLIQVNDGDTLVVHVQNQLVNSTSIHWHGIFQNGTNHMDGTVGITQCPIAPGGSFKYEFTLRGQSGTYFYHAHQGVQASDGIVGPLIIHSRDEKRYQKLKYDTDRVILISDHYHDTTSELLMTYLASDRENVEPVPDGALINGINIRDCDALEDRRCDNSTTQRPQFNLASNQSHRLRFVNTGAIAEFQIQIDEHEFAVTEVDGTDVLPAYYHRLNISPAQRYSIVLDTNVTTSDNFWLRGRMITHCFGEKNKNQEPEIRAIVRYAEDLPADRQSAISEPQSKDWPEVVEVLCKDMNTSDLIPSHPIAAPAKPDHFFYIRSSFQIGAWRLSRGFFNTTSWRPNAYSPSLSRIIDGFAAGNESFALGAASNGAEVNSRAFSQDRELVIQTTGIQTIDLLIQNFDDGNHPMHLHGYKYFVLASGHGGFEPDVVYPTLDLRNPLRRDTATIESYGWLLIRVIADNPGLWALHCHISWHSESGLVMQLLTRADIVAGWEEPAANKALCEAQGLERGMVPPDEYFYGEE